MPLTESQKNEIRKNIDSFKPRKMEIFSPSRQARLESESVLKVRRHIYFSNIEEASTIDPTFVLPLVYTLIEYLDYVGDKTRFASGDVVEAIEMLQILASKNQQFRKEIERLAISKVEGLAVSFEPNVKQSAIRLLQVIRYGQVFSYDHLIRRMKINGATVIMGAGFSYDSYVPLQQETDLMLQNALYKINSQYTRKWMESNEREAWSTIAKSPEGFKKVFAESVKAKTPSPQHLYLAKLFQMGVVKHVVDFNWDDLLERAYETLFHTKPTKITVDGTKSNHAIWKPHGDVGDLTGEWMFPYSDGRVFQSIRECVIPEPSVVVVIGYSETERIVKEHLMKKLEDKTEVYRFRPNIDTSMGIRDNAATVMKKLLGGWAGDMTIFTDLIQGLGKMVSKD